MKKNKNVVILSNAERNILSQAADILSILHRTLERNNAGEYESDCFVCDYSSIEESIYTLDFFSDYSKFFYKSVLDK